MTRSADDLPPALNSLWRTIRIGYRAEPKLLLVSFAMTVFTALPDALIALWLALLADGVIDGDRSQVNVASLGLAASAVGLWLCPTPGRHDATSVSGPGQSAFHCDSRASAMIVRKSSRSVASFERIGTSSGVKGSVGAEHTLETMASCMAVASARLHSWNLGSLPHLTTSCRA